jgi:hypothetical protein
MKNTFDYPQQANCCMHCKNVNEKKEYWDSNEYSSNNSMVSVLYCKLSKNRVDETEICKKFTKRTTTRFKY